MGLVLSALANITAQWLPNWNRGLDRIQRSEMIGITLQRHRRRPCGGAIRAGRVATRSGPFFAGSEQSVIFVRTALGPNAGPGLDVVRLSETTDKDGLATVRSRTPFRPMPPERGGSDQLHFREPVVLLRAPYQLSFAYAGEDQEWQSSWRDSDKLPAKIRLTVRDSSQRRVRSRRSLPFTSSLGARRVQASRRKVRRQCRRAGDTQTARQQANSSGRIAAGWQRRARRFAMRRPLRQAARSSQRGFIIIAVLWILMALSTLAMVFSVYLSNSARALGATDIGVESDALVSASLELTAYQLLSADEKSRPSQGSFRFRLDNADALVTLYVGSGAGRSQPRPEGNARRACSRFSAWNRRRLANWPTASSAGGPSPNAECDARSAKDEGALYLAAGLNYAPRGAPFAHVNELSLVLGATPAIVERVLPFVTVFSKSADIDVLACAAGGNRCIAGHDARGAQRFSEAAVVIAARSEGDRGRARSGQGGGDLAGCQGLSRSDHAAVRQRPPYVVRSGDLVEQEPAARTAPQMPKTVKANDKEPYSILSWQDQVETCGPVPQTGRWMMSIMSEATALFEEWIAAVAGAVESFIGRYAPRPQHHARRGKRGRPDREAEIGAKRSANYRIFHSGFPTAGQVRPCRRIGRRRFAAAGSKPSSRPLTCCFGRSTFQNRPRIFSTA